MTTQSGEPALNVAEAERRVAAAAATALATATATASRRVAESTRAARRAAEADDRVARLRALHLREGTAGLVEYCQRRLEQSLPTGR